MEIEGKTSGVVVERLGLEVSRFPGIAAVAGLAVCAKQAGVDGWFLVAGHTLRPGPGRSGCWCGIDRRKFAHACLPGESRSGCGQSFNGIPGGIETAALVLDMAGGTLVNRRQAPMQALLALNLGGNLGMAVHAQHGLVFLQGQVAQGAVIFKVGVRCVVLQNHAWQTFGADWSRGKTDPAKQPGDHPEGNHKNDRNCDADR